MRVTVAICTWNRSELLRKTLEQMTHLRTPADVEWDVLVADNNSTDRTQDVLREFQTHLPLRTVFEPQPGQSYARNRILREAAGDYILWTDDDVLVPEDWLIEFDRAIRAYPQAAVIGGPIDPWFLTQPDPDLLAAFPSLKNGFCGTDHELASGLLPRDALIYGANMAFKRAAVKEFTFDVRLGTGPGLVLAGGEEGEFIRRVREHGGSVVWWKGLNIRHCVAPDRTTLTYLKRYTMAKGREQVRLVLAEDRSVRMFGAPRWLWRTWVTNRLLYAAGLCGFPLREPTQTFHKLLPHQPLTRRAIRLSYRRESWFLQGMIREYRDAHQVAASRKSAAAEGSA